MHFLITQRACTYRWGFDHGRLKRGPVGVTYSGAAPTPDCESIEVVQPMLINQAQPLHDPGSLAAAGVVCGVHAPPPQIYKVATGVTWTDGKRKQANEQTDNCRTS